jgi:NADPH:quinone reductase-like Zn-dependent oxidoreductase
MKALTFKRYGKSPEIGFADVPRPTLKADELLVQVHAASVNPIDNMIPTGLFKAVVRFELPATLGSDLAGLVIRGALSFNRAALQSKRRLSYFIR